MLGSEIHATRVREDVQPHAGVVDDAEHVVDIHFHICAATTVGIAHGTSITARMTPRPLKPELTTRAMISPSTNSKATVMR